MHNPEITLQSLPDGLDRDTVKMLKCGVDIYLFSGDLEPGLERSMCDYVYGRKSHDHLLLILTTPGGSADTAYSIARKLNRAYGKFAILVNGYCKSAGTLLALGAKELVVTPDAEFGPLDVQLFSPDEFMKRSSGLTITQAMKWVNEQSFEAFEQIFLNLRGRSGGNITTKTAGDIASSIVGSLYGSITDKVDPVTVGEMQRAVDIAIEYGKRLGVPASIVDHLVKGYPSHGFVIDYQEAMALFPNSREVTQGEYRIVCEICSILYHEFGDDYTVEPHSEGILAGIRITQEAIDEAKAEPEPASEESSEVCTEEVASEQSKNAAEGSDK